VQLLLIRHADAGDRDPLRWPDDTLRPLTAKGRKRQRRVAKRLRRRGLVPTLLLSSPWSRAWETAELVADITGAPSPVACPALAAPPEPSAIAAAVGRPGAETILALVGHEPWLGELASLLLAGEPHRLSIAFPKSGVLGLTADGIAAGGAALAFFWNR
jgi:phosphohistidine phosphatase